RTPSGPDAEERQKGRTRRGRPDPASATLAGRQGRRSQSGWEKATARRSPTHRPSRWRAPVRLGPSSQERPPAEPRMRCHGTKAERTMTSEAATRTDRAMTPAGLPVRLEGVSIQFPPTDHPVVALRELTLDIPA